MELEVSLIKSNQINTNIIKKIKIKLNFVVVKRFEKRRGRKKDRDDDDD